MTKHTSNVCETINGAISVSVVPSQWCSPGQESWSPPVLGLSELCSVQPAKSERRFILATLPLTHSYITQPTSELQFRSAVWNFKSTTLTTENCLHILSSYLWSAKKKKKKKKFANIHKRMHTHTHARTNAHTHLESVSKCISLGSNSPEFNFSLFPVISDPVLEFRGLKLPLDTSQLLLSLYLNTHTQL